ncbi:MAG TPA: ABC transporter ATP-binding protein [Candidatus Saccharimonadales bacterium]|nr:ABC transporter ATP-binding protein [Candidatus Saccharimonadales bacterium]
MTQQISVQPRNASADHATTGDAVRVEGVSRSYGAVRAVDDVSLSVGRGQTVALLGPNGAGKTTTITMILGLARPDQGTVAVLGTSPEDAVARGLIGAMLQDGGMMPGVQVGELLAMVRNLFPAPLSLRETMVVAQLEGLEKRRVDRLSGGQSQRLRLAMALVGDPELLILDEPTAAMDVEARRNFWHEMRGFTDRGRTILFSTHYLEEADITADRIILMARGRVVADGTPSAIKNSVGLRVIRFTVVRAETSAFDSLPGVVAASAHGNRVELRCHDADLALRALLNTRPDAHDIEVSGIALEDAFLSITDGVAA